MAIGKVEVRGARSDANGIIDGTVKHRFIENASQVTTATGSGVPSEALVRQAS